MSSVTFVSKAGASNPRRRPINGPMPSRRVSARTGRAKSSSLLLFFPARANHGNVLPAGVCRPLIAALSSRRPPNIRYRRVPHRASKLHLPAALKVR